MKKINIWQIMEEVFKGYKPAVVMAFLATKIGDYKIGYISSLFRQEPEKLEEQIMEIQAKLHTRVVHYGGDPSMISNEYAINRIGECVLEKEDLDNQDGI